MLTRRHRQLQELLKQAPEMSIQDLTEQLGVSPATVRRDLALLESRGLIRRLRGGASIAEPLGAEPSYVERSRRNVREKRAIARAANGQIKDGQVIALDVGSTTLELARLLVMRASLTVFTASLPAAEVLIRGRPTVYLLGGRLRPLEMSLTGPLAREIAGRFHFDTFFLGASAWSLDKGFMDFSVEDVEIKRTLASQSQEVVALVDSSKYGQTSLMSVVELSGVARIVTDDGLPAEARDGIADVTRLDVVQAKQLEGSFVR